MKLQLSIRAMDLPKGGNLYAVVYNESSSSTLGKTQPTGPGVSPTWRELVSVDSSTTEEDKINVVIYNADDGDSIVASSPFCLSEVLESKPQSAQAKLTSEQGSEQQGKKAKICIHVQEEQVAQLHMVLGAKNLPDTDLGFTFSKQLTDPFFEIYAKGKKLVRSNVCHDTLNPTWHAVVLDLNMAFHTKDEKLDLDNAAVLKITLYDKDKGDAKEYLGQVEQPVSQILKAAGNPNGFPLVFNRGSLLVKEAKLLPQQYISRSAKKAMGAVAGALAMDLGAIEKAQAHADEMQADYQTKQKASQAAIDKATVLVKREEEASEAQGKAQDAVSTLADKAKGFVMLQAETACTGKLQVQLRAEKLPDTDFGVINKTDPVYQVYSAHDGLVKVHRSNIVKNNLNPTWDMSKIDLVKLCQGNLHAPFRIAFYDKDGGDDTDYLGILNVTVNQLLKASPKQEFKLEKAKRGSVFVVSAELVNHTDIAEKLTSLREELTAAKKVLDETKAAWKTIHAKADKARQVAVEAQEAAEEAQDEAEASLLAVEMARASLE